jgi:signal transduction histidine kinase
VENLSRGLRQGASSETIASRADAIRRSSRRLATLVDEMLNVSRITSGVIPVALEPVELSVFVRDATNHFLDQMATAETRAALSVDGPIWCRTDRERLGYVFNNLVANAIKYGGRQPIEIRVARDAGFARLSVRDHGPGISTEDQKRIFERFERAVSASHVSGFGLGLWIARRTVEALGGTIRVESRPGEGSTFSVDLPLDAGPALGEALTPTAGGPGATVPAAPGTGRTDP